MDKINKLLQDKKFRIMLIGISAALIIGLSLMIVFINADKVLTGPMKTFDNYFNAVKEKDLYKLAAALYPENTPQYNDFIAENSDYFDTKVNIALQRSSSSYTYRKNWKEINLACYEVQTEYTDTLGNIQNINLIIYFVKISGKWYLTSDINNNSTLNPKQNGPNNGGNNGGFMDNPNPETPLRLSDKQNITTYTVKNGEYVDNETFFGCENLIEITLPASYVRIEPYWFYDCKNLTRILIDGNSEYFTSVDGVIYNKDMTVLYVYPAGKIQVEGGDDGVFTLPDTVTTIRSQAFFRARGISKVVFSPNLKTVAPNAFSECSNLYEVVMNDGLETIGNNAFERCEDLYAIDLPDSVKSIGNDAFYDCQFLTVFDISEQSSLEFLGYGVFDNCIRLAEIYLPDKIEALGNWVFQNCYALKEVRLPANLKSIGMFAFRYCLNLESLYLSDKVTAVGKGAFQTCSRLELKAQAASKPTGWSQEWDLGIVNPIVWGAEA